MVRALTFVLFLVFMPAVLADEYGPVNAIFSKYCLDCHSSKDPDGKLVLENFESLMKGGENGPVIVPANSGASPLVRMIEGTMVKDGKKIVMPPGKKRKKLNPEEIVSIKTWIDAGAHAPIQPQSVLTELNLPKIAPIGAPRNPINALINIPHSDLLAEALYGEVELRSSENGELKRTLSGHRGSVNALAVSPDGKQLFSAAGEPARFGEWKEWNLADGSLVGEVTGHKDAIYALAVSPDGKIVASGSYDQKIILWDRAERKALRTLTGHNGAIFGLAFRPDGKILASASADHTVKLWDVATGKRRDTLSQPLKDVYAVAFSPDGKRLVAGGADNRIRVWEISETAAETTNPLLDTKFAHEGAVLRVAFSPDGKWLLSSADDRTVRLWAFPEIKERLLLEKQPDWATGLDFIRDGKSMAVGRLDGSLGLYGLDGKPVTLIASANVPKPSPMMEKPEITRVEPRGMQRGTELRIQLTGKNLLGLTNINFRNPKLAARLEPGTTSTSAWINVKAASDLRPDDYEFSAAATNGESSPVKLQVGRWPHVFESQTNFATQVVSLPVTCWGALNPAGDIDVIRFRAEAGQNIVFDLAAKRLGSKLNASLTLLDGEGKTLASQGEFDGSDPLLAFTFSSNGVYRIRLCDETADGSPDFFYGLSIGELPMVIGVFPPSVATNAEAEVQLLGYNLAGRNKMRVCPTNSGEMEIPIDSEKFEARRSFKILVTDGPEFVEVEPNDTPAQATPITAPCVVSGWIKDAVDVDLFRFEAKAKEQWIIETDASRRGSPIDTKIEVLRNDGTPIKRLQLQAVRDSAITFRNVDSSSTEFRMENWQEMEINEFLYMQGEVCKIFRMPLGPDSGVGLYAVAGKRRDYFDTSAVDHALDEPCYVVEPHSPEENLTPNGLPVFPVYYANDDDGSRELGTDSRIHFTAPADGPYLIRVSDSRGHGGDRFVYRLIVRKPQPDFTVALNGKTLAPSVGAGRAFSVTANRTDDFDGEIRVNITGIPAGFRISTPLIIQAEQNEAKGTLSCDSNAVAPTTEEIAKIKLTAQASLNGAEITKSVGEFEKITIGEPSKLFVALEPKNERTTNFVLRSVAEKLLEITIAPGGTEPAWIKIQRHGHEEAATFAVENLPHGVIVDNIGLNGVLIPKGEDRREIFLKTAKWVPEMDRLIYLRASEAGGPASLPVELHVRSVKTLSEPMANRAH